MAVTQAAQERLVALAHIRVPENVRELDASHVDALAGSIALQGMLVLLVVRAEGERFELVAGFHRIAAAPKLDLTEVPVVVRDGASEDADRAVENITSCRDRHEVIYADRVVMPMSELKCPTARCEPGGEVGIRTRTDPGSQAAADGLAEVGAAARLRKASARPAPGDTLAFRPKRARARRQ
jgi:ParB/Sulfiredoxin domain